MTNLEYVCSLCEKGFIYEYDLLNFINSLLPQDTIDEIVPVYANAKIEALDLYRDGHILLSLLPNKVNNCFINQSFFIPFIITSTIEKTDFIKLLINFKNKTISATKNNQNESELLYTLDDLNSLENMLILQNLLSQDNDNIELLIVNEFINIIIDYYNKSNMCIYFIDLGLLDDNISIYKFLYNLLYANKE